MTKFLYWAVKQVAKIHSYLIQLNNAHEMEFSDKELHFLVIGLLGMAMIFVVYPLFKFLAKHDHEMVIAWIYVFTVIIVITFAIEIGQKIAGTGHMEFADIAYGTLGFLAMFLAFSVLRGIYHLIRKLVKYLVENSSGKGRYAE